MLKGLPEEKKYIYINNKIAITTALSIITLHVNELNALINRHKVAKWVEQITHIYVSARDPLQIERHKQTESKGMEKDYFMQMAVKKESWGSNTYVRQNRL